MRGINITMSVHPSGRCLLPLLLIPQRINAPAQAAHPPRSTVSLTLAHSLYFLRVFDGYVSSSRHPLPPPPPRRPLPSLMPQGDLLDLRRQDSCLWSSGGLLTELGCIIGALSLRHAISWRYSYRPPICIPWRPQRRTGCHIPRLLLSSSLPRSDELNDVLILKLSLSHYITPRINGFNLLLLLTFFNQRFGLEGPLIVLISSSPLIADILAFLVSFPRRRVACARRRHVRILLGYLNVLGLQLLN